MASIAKNRAIRQAYPASLCDAVDVRMRTLAALCVALSLVQRPSYARRLAWGSSKAKDKGNHYPKQPKTDGRQLFLLLTTQRSGSTWACQLLSAQPGITCGMPNNSSVTGASPLSDER